VSFSYVKLQHGRDRTTYSLHARPGSYGISGLQSTDVLAYLGFSRGSCGFYGGECYAREIGDRFDVASFAQQFAEASSAMMETDRHLQKCGVYLRRSEGLGYFLGKPSSPDRVRRPHIHGDGHSATKIERMKVAQDDVFHFVFTWIESGNERGWTTHYRPKHAPLSAEMLAAVDFMGGFRLFEECPEFDFQSCLWRFVPYEERGEMAMLGNANYAYACFDAHETSFSSGVEGILRAHALVQPFGLTFLNVREAETSLAVELVLASPPRKPERQQQVRPFKFDVAISFAGAQRELAERLAKAVRDAGYSVFYDDFYKEQLWGKDLPVFFDMVYRKESRFCLIFISREYGERFWTNHERRSAQARALQERGNEYILPIRVDGTELDGMPPTVGYLSLDEHCVEEIASILLAKLRR
jgi:hypothetical protein